MSLIQPVSTLRLSVYLSLPESCIGLLAYEPLQTLGVVVCSIQNQYNTGVFSVEANSNLKSLTLGLYHFSLLYRFAPYH